MRIAYLFIALMLLIPAASAAPVASFTVSYYNTTDGTLWKSSTMNFTKGQIVSFNASSAGVTRWEWDFGDGFTNGGENATHQYKFGRGGHSLLLTSGWTKVTVRLNASDASSCDYSEKILNITTAMDDLSYVGPSATIEMINESYANTFISAIGGNVSVKSDWAGFDWEAGVGGVAAVYESSLGSLIFYLLLFSLPFFMSWVVSKDFVVSGILGGIIGIWMINRLPGAMKAVAVVFIAMSIVAIIYSLLKER